MSIHLDAFIGQYISLVQREIADRQLILKSKDFQKKSEFVRVQSQIQGLELALELINSIPESE